MTNFDRKESARGILNGFTLAFLMLMLLMVCVGLWGCQRLPSSPPVVMTRTSLQSDSLVTRLFSMLADERRETRRDSFIQMVRYVEKTVVNERGDTTRHDTRTEITTAQYQALERENSVLMARIDSLERVRNRVDTVPVPVEVRVPYPVERGLTAWEKVKMDFGGIAFGGVAVAAVAVAVMGWLARKRRK